MPCSYLVLSKFHEGEQQIHHSPKKKSKKSQNNSSLAPILCLDVLNKENEIKILTAGADNAIRIWEFLPSKCATSNIHELAKGIASTNNVDDQKENILNHPGFSTNWFKFCSDLIRHEKAVNVAKYSPSGMTIASGSDDSNILLWRKTDQPQKIFGSNQEENYQTEYWQPLRSISGGHT